jgi:hypothetical protein
VEESPRQQFFVNFSRISAISLNEFTRKLQCSIVICSQEKVGKGPFLDKDVRLVDSLVFPEASAQSSHSQQLKFV